MNTIKGKNICIEPLREPLKGSVIRRFEGGDDQGSIDTERYKRLCMYRSYIRSCATTVGARVVESEKPVFSADQLVDRTRFSDVGDIGPDSRVRLRKVLTLSEYVSDPSHLVPPFVIRDLTKGGRGKGKLLIKNADDLAKFAGLLLNIGYDNLDPNIVVEEFVDSPSDHPLSLRYHTTWNNQYTELAVTYGPAVSARVMNYSDVNAGDESIWALANPNSRYGLDHSVAFQSSAHFAGRGLVDTGGKGTSFGFGGSSPHHLGDDSTRVVGGFITLNPQGDVNLSQTERDIVESLGINPHTCEFNHPGLGVLGQIAQTRSRVDRDIVALHSGVDAIFEMRGDELFLVPTEVNTLPTVQTTRQRMIEAGVPIEQLSDEELHLAWIYRSMISSWRDQKRSKRPLVSKRLLHKQARLES